VSTQSGEQPEAYRNWRNPRALYARGYPPGMTSALQVFHVLQTRLRKLVDALEPEFVLEVGPGDRPIVEPGPGRVFLDLSRHLLRSLCGQRVEGDICRAPFADGMFDLVVVADIFTHLSGFQRGRALEEMARLAPAILVFNPEPGTKRFVAAPVPTREVIVQLRKLGFETQVWPVVMGSQAGGQYRFGIVLAKRGAG